MFVDEIDLTIIQYYLYFYLSNKLFVIFLIFFLGVTMDDLSILTYENKKEELLMIKTMRYTM